MYLYASIVWSVAWLAWLINTSYYHRSYVVRVQRKLAIVPILKVVSLVFAYIFWRVRASGQPRAEYNTSVLPVVHLTSVLYRAVFFECILLLAKGTCHAAGHATLCHACASRCCLAVQGGLSRGARFRCLSAAYVGVVLPCERLWVCRGVVWCHV